MDPDWLEAARKGAAEYADEFRHREVEKCAVAVRFEFRGQSAAEISFDERTPQRLELVRRGRRTIGAREHARVCFEFVGAVERDEKLVVVPQWQTLRGVDFRRQRRRELDALVRQQRAWDRHDGLIGRDRAAHRLHPQPLAAVIDRVHRAIEHRGQTGTGGGDDGAEALDHAPIDPAVRVAVEILGRNTIPFGAADISADGIDEAVPAAARFERRRGWNIGLVRRDLFEARKEFSHRLVEFVLLGAREHSIE